MMAKVEITDMAKYIGLSLLTKGYNVSPLKLQKMLYYAQAWHMVFFGRENTLFEESPQAWVNGPVYPCIYNIYKDKVPGMCDHLVYADFCDGSPEEVMKELLDGMAISDEEIRFLESIVQLYGSKTQNQLVFFTHSEAPWCEMREGLMPYERSSQEISLDRMYQYYKERHDKRRERNAH